MSEPLTAPLSPVLRRLLRAWGRTRVAPGHFYQAVERWGKHLTQRPIECRLFNGCAMVCDLHDHIQRHIYYFGAYEPIEAFLFHKLIAPGMSVIDAGANVGQYTLIAAKSVGPNGQVHAFEPIPHNFEALVRHLRMNRLDGRVHANSCALWDSSRNLRLSIGEDDVADNATNYSVSIHDTTASTVECRSITLDEYARDVEMSRLDLIKMDIEGAELPAIRGAKDVLESFHPTILMEINRAHSDSQGYDPESIGSLLKSYGYDSIRIIGHSPDTSLPLGSLAGVDRANVLFSKNALPESLWEGWSFKQILADFRAETYSAEPERLVNA